DDGTILNPYGTLLPTDEVNPYGTLVATSIDQIVASASKQFLLLVWREAVVVNDDRTVHIIRGLRVAADGSALDSAPSTVFDPGPDQDVEGLSLISDGSGFLLAWREGDLNSLSATDFVRVLTPSAPGGPITSYSTPVQLPLSVSVDATLVPSFV